MKVPNKHGENEDRRENSKVSEETPGHAIIGVEEGHEKHINENRYQYPMMPHAQLEIFSHKTTTMSRA